MSEKLGPLRPLRLSRAAEIIIAKKAHERNVSFTEYVRDLVDWLLEAKFPDDFAAVKDHTRILAREKTLGF